MKKRLTIQTAIETIRQKRSIAPNEGFTEQLIELNDSVHGLIIPKSSEVRRL
jgi:hypothetical protein